MNSKIISITPFLFSVHIAAVAQSRSSFRDTVAEVSRIVNKTGAAKTEKREIHLYYVLRRRDQLLFDFSVPPTAVYSIKPGSQSWETSHIDNSTVTGPYKFKTEATRILYKSPGDKKWETLYSLVRDHWSSAPDLLSSDPLIYGGYTKFLGKAWLTDNLNGQRECYRFKSVRSDRDTSFYSIVLVDCELLIPLRKDVFSEYPQSDFEFPRTITRLRIVGPRRKHDVSSVKH